MQLIIDKDNYILVKDYKGNIRPAIDLLRESREEKRMSIKHLEDEIGVNHPLYYNLEKGLSRNQNSTLILKGLQYFGYSLNIFWEGKG